MNKENKKISKRKFISILNSVFSAFIVGVSAFALTTTIDEFGPFLKDKKSEKSSIQVYEEEFFKTTNNLIDRKDSLSINI